MDPSDATFPAGAPLFGGEGPAFVTFYKDTGRKDTSRYLGTFCVGPGGTHDPIPVGNEDPWTCPECGAVVSS